MACAEAMTQNTLEYFRVSLEIPIYFLPYFLSFLTFSKRPKKTRKYAGEFLVQKKFGF